MTKTKIRKLCEKAFSYGTDNKSLKEFYNNEGKEIKRKPALRLRQLLVDHVKYRSFIVREYNLDRLGKDSVYEDIVRECGLENVQSAKEATIFTPAKLYEEIVDLPYSNEYSPSRFGFNTLSCTEKMVFKHNNIKYKIQGFVNNQS